MEDEFCYKSNYEYIYLLNIKYDSAIFDLMNCEDHLKIVSPTIKANAQNVACSLTRIRRVSNHN